MKIFGNPTRRDFGKMLLVGAVGFASIDLASCDQATLQTILTDIEDWAPTAEKAVNSILAIIDPTPAAQAAAALVEGVINQLLADVQQYLNTNPPPVGLLAKIQAILQDVATNYQAFLNTINVTSPAVGAVIAIAELVFAAISGFISQVLKHAPPAAKAKLKALAVTVSSFKFQGQSYSVKPKEMTGSSLKAGVNAALDQAKAQGANVPESAYIK